MIDSLGNMPSHPLLVHIPVVLVPLTLLGTIIMAARPSLRRPYSTPVTVVAGIAFLGSFLAADSGRSLERQFTDAGQTIPIRLQEHIDMGSRPQYFAGMLLALLVIWSVVLRRQLQSNTQEHDSSSPESSPKRRTQAIALMSLVLLTGAVTTISVLRTGHSGAQSVWEQVTP